MLAPISKTLPVGLCCNYGTELGYDGKRVPLCLASKLKEASLSKCSSVGGRGCSRYEPEWYGFEEGYRG